MSLKDIYCQGRAIGLLQGALNAGKFAHAYIFAGQSGVGKFTTASELAKMLLCHDRTEEQTAGEPFFDSCGRCQSCLVFDGGAHPDFTVIYKELVKFTKDGKGKSTPKGSSTRSQPKGNAAQMIQKYLEQSGGKIDEKSIREFMKKNNLKESDLQNFFRGETM